MIQINLLPEERREKLRTLPKIDLSEIDLESIPLVRIGAAAGGALVLIYIALFLMTLYAQSSYKALDKKYEEVLPKKRLSDALKTKYQVLTKKVGAIDELMVNRFNWAKKLNDLSNSMVSGVWLSEFSYDEKVVERPAPPPPPPPEEGAEDKPRRAPRAPKAPAPEVTRYLTLSGYALNNSNEGTATIGKFIKTLKENKDFYSDFRDIELGSIKREKDGDQEVMSFTITCFFK